MARDNGSAVKETISSSTSATTSSTYSRTQFIKDVQAAINVTVDGIVGNKTLNVLPTVSKTKNNKHAVVKILQTYLNTIEYGCGSADGIFGEKTRTAVKTFQKDNKLTSDGIVGKNTWNKLLGYKG